MGRSLGRKLKTPWGISRLTVILLVLVLVLLALLAVPAWKRFKATSDRVGCVQSLDSATRQIAADIIANNPNPTAEDVKKEAARAMLGWDDICPAGGTVYVVINDGGAQVSAASRDLPFKLVCGLHGEDAKEKIRLNADYVLEELEAELIRQRQQGNPYPESMTVTLHHKPLTAVLVDENVGLRWGTNASMDYEGTVVFYSIVGHSDFGADSGVAQGKIWYYCYADEDHCANWTKAKGWTGDSYGG